MIVVPSISLVTLIWHPSLDLQQGWSASVGVALTSPTPKANHHRTEEDCVRIGESECEIQHVVLGEWKGQRFSWSFGDAVKPRTHLVIRRLLQLVVDIVLKNHMASRAGDGLLTSGCRRGFGGDRTISSMLTLHAVPDDSSAAGSMERKLTFNVQVPLPGYIHNIVPLIGFHRLDLAVTLFEVQGDAGDATGQQEPEDTPEMTAYPSPFFGRPFPP